jgi:hypothetical protein
VTDPTPTPPQTATEGPEAPQAAPDGFAADHGPSVAEAAADDHAHWNDRYAGEGE